MCGICGFVNLDGTPADREILQRMNRALVHRGPDEEGVQIISSAAIAMRRLSIIDLASGHQPMSNEDHTVWIVFNGEIYNSPSLNQELRNLGHRFATHNSDTESIVHLYEDKGWSCADLLRGMFAFAILDLRGPSDCHPRIVLARDRLGIKPLFYYVNERLIAFSSELTSLLQHPSVPRQIDPLALRQYLAAGAAASPLTLFKDVRQLLPGQRLDIQANRLKIETYWSPPSMQSAQVLSPAETSLQARRLLEDAVQSHLLSDVPVGAFLSGGIDSSTIVALMARASSRRISTFSIRFEEMDYDESPLSRLVAERYDTDHHEFTIKNRGFDLGLLEAMITHHGQPTADTSAIPTFVISQLAREQVKVALSGDGGDECFAGYSHFQWAQQIAQLYAFPHAARQIGAALLSRAADVPGLRGRSQLRQAINALQASLADQSALPLEVIRINRDFEVDNLLMPDWCESSILDQDHLQTYLKEHAAAHSDPVRNAQAFSFHYYLPDVYLAKVDRMSMANALEVRVPFLDHYLVEFALTLPTHFHWQNGSGKQILRQAVADLLPEEIFSHRKQGFSIPLHRWTTSAYFALARDLLSVDSVRRRGIFNAEAVQNLLKRNEVSQAQNSSVESNYRLSHRLFMLVAFELWCRMYIDNLVEQPSETARWTTYVSS